MTTAPARIVGLRCRACGRGAPLGPTHVCELCFGPLEVAYDYTEVAPLATRAAIEAGPTSMWRYRMLLPYEAEEAPVSLGEGLTPLVHAERLGEQLGLRRLYLKNDSQNPTNSFKDRVVSVAASWARQQGFQVLACASTGNLANAVAAYAARSGLRGLVVIPDDLEPGKVAPTAVFDPVMVRVRGTYDDVNRLCSELADRMPWGFCNINLRPFYSEGSKTLTFETCEQLGWRMPDEIVIPVASGCQFVKHAKALDELRQLELVEPGRPPRLTGAQARGCAPVATAFERGETHIVPVREPRTVARSIAIGNPSDGSDVVRLARASGGVVTAVEEEEILEGIELLARTEGIFTETAGGVTVAVLARLARQGRWSRDATVVAYITGHGLKTVGALEGRTRVPEPIPARLRAVLAADPGGLLEAGQPAARRAAG